MQSDPGAVDFTQATMLPQMRDGEQIVWTGRPTTLWTLQPTDRYSLLFGIPWTLGVPAIWLTIFGGTIPAPFLVFWLIGLVCSFLPIITRRVSLGKVRYVLSSERAFILNESTRRRLRQVALADCGTELRGLRPDGTGTVFFFAPDPPPSLRMARWYGYIDYRYRFDFVAISNAQRLYELTDGRSRPPRVGVIDN